MNRQAIVLGNGPSVLRCSREVVEAHEVIVRCNGFVIDGFEEQVGTRTDVYAVHIEEQEKWSEFWERPRDSGPRPIVWLVAGNVLRTRRSPLEVRKMIPEAQWFLPEELLHAKLDLGMTGGLFPTTGFLALWRATRRFRTPVGYAGFSNYDQGYHYYWNLHDLNPPPPMHSAALEQAWIKRAEQEGVVEPVAA